MSEAVIEETTSEGQAAADAAATAAATAAEKDTSKGVVNDLLGDETPEDKAAADAAAKEAGEKGDKKTAADKPDGKADGEGEVDGAPETYEDFDLPDGMEADVDGLAAFGTLAKEFDLSQGQAQQLVDVQAELVQRNADAAWQVWADKQNEWALEVRNDKVFGGDKLDGSKAAAKAFVMKFGGQEALEILRLTGASNHPKVFGALARAGKELAEDEIVSGANVAGEAPSRAKVLFPDMN